MKGNLGEKASSVYSTLRAAREAGYRDMRPYEYGGEQIRIKGHVLVRNPEVAVSRSEWDRRGFTVPADAKSHALVQGTVGGRHSSWDVFRQDQVVPKRVRNSTEPKEVPILAALWAANRAAKRCRDVAKRRYAARAYGLASHAKVTKERLYHLKEQALHHVVDEDTLVLVGYHQFPGDLWAEVLRGGGYGFHRPCAPPDPVPDGSSQLDGVEAKPRKTREPRLKDAVFTLERYLAGRPEVTPYRWPERPRGGWKSERDAHAPDVADGDQEGDFHEADED